MIIAFTVAELSPSFERLSFGKKYLPLGGLLSGFLGGLSGHQGALRSAFLVKCGLSKEGFIATGVVIACLVDFSRISVYSTHMIHGGIQDNGLLLFAATASAFLGAWLGTRLVKKVTLRTIRNVVSAMLIVIAVLLGSGLI